MFGYIGYAVNVESSPLVNFRVVHPFISVWIPLHDESKKCTVSVVYLTKNAWVA